MHFVHRLIIQQEKNITKRRLFLRKEQDREPDPDTNPYSVRIPDIRIRLKMCHERGTLHRTKAVFFVRVPPKKITILSMIYLDERHPEPEVCDAVGCEERGRVPVRPGAGETAVVLPARLCGGGQGGPPARPQDPATEPQAPPSRRGCPPSMNINVADPELCSDLLARIMDPVPDPVLELQTVLRIRDVYPGSRMFIPDPGS